MTKSSPKPSPRKPIIRMTVLYPDHFQTFIFTVIVERFGTADVKYDCENLDEVFEVMKSYNR